MYGDGVDIAGGEEEKDDGFQVEEGK